MRAAYLAYQRYRHYGKSQRSADTSTRSDARRRRRATSGSSSSLKPLSLSDVNNELTMLSAQLQFKSDNEFTVDEVRRVINRAPELAQGLCVQQEAPSDVELSYNSLMAIRAHKRSFVSIATDNCGSCV